MCVYQISNSRLNSKVCIFRYSYSKWDFLSPLCRSDRTGEKWERKPKKAEFFPVGLVRRKNRFGGSWHCTVTLLSDLQFPRGQREWCAVWICWGPWARDFLWFSQTQHKSLALCNTKPSVVYVWDLSFAYQLCLKNQHSFIINSDSFNRIIYTHKNFLLNLCKKSHLQFFKDSVSRNI